MSTNLKIVPMSHKRKGQLTVSKEWAKHLRKFWRRKFWKGERNAGKRLIKNEAICHQSLI